MCFREGWYRTANFLRPLCLFVSLNSPQHWSLHIDVLSKCLLLPQEELTTASSVASGGIWVLPSSLPPMREEMTRSHSFLSWPPRMHQTDPGDALDHACKLLNSQSQTASCCPQATLCPSTPRSVWHQADHLFLTCGFPLAALVRHRKLREHEKSSKHTPKHPTGP